jgi:hypothetical protein
VSRLTVLAGLPPADAKRVGPHSYRRLAGRVLATNEWGGRAVLSEDEYRRFLAGLDENDPLWAPLQAKGFVRSAFDFDAAAAEVARRSLASWRGPSTHAIFLERGGKLMSLETARACVDFVFSSPARPLTVELVAADAEAAWPCVWFAVQYARRRAEWARRPLFLVLRSRGGLSAERVEFLRGHAVTRRWEFDLDGPPDFSSSPAFPAQRALCAVGRGASDPAGWVDALTGWGLDSVRIFPSRELLFSGGAASFIGFYGAFIDRLVERGDEGGPIEETAAAFLNGLAWNLPGIDILEGLAYSPDGGVHSSEEGLALAESGRAAFRLGEAGALRYEDIASLDAARACLTAVVPDNQPMCSQCVYRSRCAVPASLSVGLQGSVWGDMVSSPACALNMALLDLLFSRLDDEKMGQLLSKWHVDKP